MEITRKYENTMKDVDYYRKQERAAYTALQNLRMQYEEVGHAAFIVFFPTVVVRWIMLGSQIVNSSNIFPKENISKSVNK